MVQLNKEFEFMKSYIEALKKTEPASPTLALPLVHSIVKKVKSYENGNEKFEAYIFLILLLYSAITNSISKLLFC